MGKKEDELRNIGITGGDLKDAFAQTIMGASAGYKAGTHSKGDDEGFYSEKKARKLREPWISQGEPEDALKYAVTGASAGYKAGSGLKDAKGDAYGQEALDGLKAKAQKEAEARIPGWIEAGSEYIYPERLEDWKKSVESSAKGAFLGQDIAKALEVMKMLDSDATVQDVVEAYKSKDHLGGYVDKLVLTFSKRGPEYVEQFMSTFGKELPPELKEKIENIRAENRQLAQNELERNRAAKETKTEELTRTSAELEELSAQSQGKDENQNIQE